MGLYSFLEDSICKVIYTIRYSGIENYNPPLPPPPNDNSSNNSVNNNNNSNRLVQWVSYLLPKTRIVTLPTSFGNGVKEIGHLISPSSIYNNKFKILFASFGGGVLYLYHSTSKSHRESQIKLAEERINTFFNNTQATCDQTTILFISKNLEHSLNRTIITPTIIEIRSASTPEIKQELTDKLKISIISKIITTLYIIPILLLFIRVQINIVGKYCYLERIIRQSVSDDPASTTDTAAPKQRPIETSDENRFFSISKFIIEKRFDEFVNVINDQVTIVLKDYKLDQLLDYEEFLKLFLRIRTRFESKEIFSNLDNPNCLSRYFMPDDNSKEYESLMLNEAKNIFESDLFYDALHDTINKSFLIFNEEFKNDFQPQQTANNQQQQQTNNQQQSKSTTDSGIAFTSPPESSKFHLIVLIPKLNKQLDRLINRDLSKTVNQIVSTTESINKKNRLILTNELNIYDAIN